MTALGVIKHLTDHHHESHQDMVNVVLETRRQHLMKIIQAMHYVVSMKYNGDSLF